MISIFSYIKMQTGFLANKQKPNIRRDEEKANLDNNLWKKFIYVLSALKEGGWRRVLAFLVASTVKNAVQGPRRRVLRGNSCHGHSRLPKSEMMKKNLWGR